MTFKEFQDIIRATYYDKDKRRGLEKTFLWLVEELGEFAKAVNRGTREDIELELSDLIAWIFSVANLLDIDVEKAISRYAKGCPKCGQIPCVCDNEKLENKEVILGKEEREG